VTNIYVGICGRGLSEQTFQIQKAVLIVIGLVRNQLGGGWVQNLNRLAPGLQVGEKDHFFVSDQF
jgi:hypothetical protein